MNTPEQYLKEKSFCAGYCLTPDALVYHKGDVINALELACTQEREKLIREIEEKVDNLLIHDEDFSGYSGSQIKGILNNLKKEKGD
jgi:transcriptional regulator of NAD metabolism